MLREILDENERAAALGEAASVTESRPGAARPASDRPEPRH
jgi:hypothetical protein